MRVFWVFNHPAPYKMALFDELGKLCDLTVVFERPKEKGRNASFYSASSHSFHAYYCHPILKFGIRDNYSRKPKKLLKQNLDADVIVLNGWRTLTEQSLIKYCKRHKIPYVFAINGGIVKPNENNIIYAIKEGAISGASLYLSPNEPSNEYLIHYGAKKEDIALFPYGSLSEKDILDYKIDDQGRAKQKKKRNIVGSKAFVSAGFFIKRKNFARLIEIWKDVPSDYSLYLIGEGPEQETYEKLISSYGLKNVFILPYMDHDTLFRHYRAFDAFLFPTKEDIYGHVVAEALSQGLPVYGSKYSTACEMMLNGENGVIADFDNAEEIRLLLARDIPLSMREKAIETAKGYTYEESARAHMAIFERYLKEKKQ